MQQVNLGMIGGGTVGSGVFHAWQRNGALMAVAPRREAQPSARSP